MLGKYQESVKKITIISSLIIVLMVIFLFALEAKAVSIDLSVSGGLGTKSLTVIIGQIIQVVLGFLGVIALGLILYAGFLWMTASGNEEKITHAKKILVNAAIGLGIILSAFAIVSFLINKLISATTPGPDQGVEQTGSGFPGSALGGGILESVYPLPNSNNNPRNTLIMAIFKEPLLGNDLINPNTDPNNLPSGACPQSQGYIVGQNCGFLKATDNVPNVKISKTPLLPDDFIAANLVIVRSSNNNKNFSFDTIPLLGNENTPENYTVTLTNNIHKATGPVAIPGGFDWSFEISTFSDNTPPTIVSVFPINTMVARNAIVQINFSEAMAVTTVSGATQTGFTNITLKYDNDQTTVNGTYNVGNLFKTVEFLSSEPCGGSNINSCGQNVYCLPGLKTFTGAVTTFVTDAAGNAIVDTAPSPWTFNTSDQLDLTAPFVVYQPPLDPFQDEQNIPLNYANVNVNGITADFNEPISALTVNTTNYILIENDLQCTNEGIAQPNQYGQYPQIPVDCWPGGFGVSFGSNSSQLKLFVYPPLDPATIYNPRLLSYITDMYQNCFVPATQH